MKEKKKRHKIGRKSGVRTYLVLRGFALPDCGFITSFSI